MPALPTSPRLVRFHLALAAALWSASSLTHGSEPAFAVPGDVQAVLARHCVDCHGPDAAEAGVRLDTVASLKLDARLALLNRVQDQVFFRTMPPPEEAQPSNADRDRVADWLRTELRRHGASELDKKLTYPDYGNYVDHDLLFGGTVTDAASTPARRWLVSPQIFRERVLDVFALEGRERENYRQRGFYGVTNPFVLPDNSGVRDYDIGTLGGGHLLVMLSNAQWIAEKQLLAARMANGEPNEKLLPNPKDRWYPRTVPAEFEAIVEKTEKPTDEEMVAAVHAQFDRVLRRKPSDEELAEYLELTRSSIGLGGNVAGLQQMLVTVLLESEFLYRLEFGAGEPDEHGRLRLAPHEAAFAISYALGDRGPDAELVAAAANGRLETKEDFEREVRRLLDDDQYYRGQVDSSLNGKHYQSNVTSHPKTIRFFREFFGYPGALKVFKDPPRSGGKWQNPGRGTHGSPGWLTYEADRIVTWHVEKDQNVFETLLTSDQFFVYHNMDNQAGVKVLDEWRTAYEKLADTEWRTKPQQVLDENVEFLKSLKSLRINDASKPGELVNVMHYFEESFGEGRNPFTRWPWSHGYYYHHSPFYGLPPTPVIGRYGSWKSTKYEDKLEPKEFWDYVPVQPFAIANRKGILTHPAWLIGHSSNFHTDPIRRGRWIREKLLAGRVPDVPITVDAQVPDDPHKTFRERVEDVTTAAECWKCHQHMNPLGLAFEMYDDFGRDRTEELLEHPDNLLKKGNGKTTFDEYPTKPVVTTGTLSGTGDPALDGDVENALDLIDRLAKSERVRQSIIRHAFRFYLGRNEMPSDSQTLIEADRAYVESGGSFRAVVVSLLTSDSFRYRTPPGDAT